MIGALTLVTFLVLLLLGVPMVFSLGLASVLGVVLLGTGSWAIVAMQVFEGLNSFPLVAIPLFLLMAQLMTVGGVTNALIRFATSLVGHIRGSLALGNVAASTVMAGVSGSCLADTVAIGSIMIPSMIREGYPPAFAGAVTAAANIVGPIIPPSILMILYGFAAEQSITQLFLGGVLPGLILSVIFGVLTYGMSVRYGYGSLTQGFNLGRTAIAFIEALPALVVPGVIVAGVFGGVFTITESAGAAAVYALLYTIGRGMARGKVPWREIAEAFHRTAVDAGTVLILLGASNLLSWVLARSQLPQSIIGALEGFDRLTTLALINVVLLIFGIFLEPAPALLLACSILLPLVKSLGINLIHFGVMMVVNLQIGVLMPPHGGSALICARMAGVPYETQIRALLPFIALGIGTVILVTYVPGLSLWVPQYFYGH
jgi:tripartite ATP-independent transporter DctM subunit